MKENHTAQSMIDQSIRESRTVETPWHADIAEYLVDACDSYEDDADLSTRLYVAPGWGVRLHGVPEDR